MLLPILKYGAQELRVPAKPVELFDRDLETIAKNMVETMYAGSGVGLAANQVGLELSLLTIDYSMGKCPSDLIIICNPEIIRSNGSRKDEEGCLSIPGFNEVLARPKRITVRGQDIHGGELQIDAEDSLAKCFCHEIDHLKGILFIDHLSALKRSLIKNKIKKLTKAGGW